MKLPIFVIGLLAAGTTLANADPATYDYTGLHFTQCDLGTCPANYASDYLIASFTVSTPPVPDLDAAQNELPFVTKWSISDKLGYLALSSSDPQAATELALLTFGTFGAFDGEFTATSQGLPGGESVSGASFGISGDGILIDPGSNGGANTWDADNLGPAVGAWVEVSAVPEPAMLWMLATELSVVVFTERIRQRRSSARGGL
jgi:hypothetical protein